MGLFNDFLEGVRGDTITAEWHSVPALNPCALGDWRRGGQMAPVRPLIAGCSSEMVGQRLARGLAPVSSLTEWRVGGASRTPPHWPSQAPAVGRGEASSRGQGEHGHPGLTAAGHAS